jgi:hypothetical protein
MALLMLVRDGIQVEMIFKSIALHSQHVGATMTTTQPTGGHASSTTTVTGHNPHAINQAIMRAPSTGQTTTPIKRQLSAVKRGWSHATIVLHYAQVLQCQQHCQQMTMMATR